MSEQVYSAKEVAEALGVGAAMLRRYAATYEKISGDEIEIHRRDGRLFTQKQVDTLLAARSIVQRQDMSVDAALETVLKGADSALVVRQVSSASIDAQVLTDALKTAVTDPLLNELQSIRAELAELRAGQDARVTAAKAEPAQVADRQHGLLVRVALRVEAWMRR